MHSPAIRAVRQGFSSTQLPKIVSAKAEEVPADILRLAQLLLIVHELPLLPLGSRLLQGRPPSHRGTFTEVSRRSSASRQWGGHARDGCGLRFATLDDALEWCEEELLEARDLGELSPESLSALDPSHGACSPATLTLSAASSLNSSNSFATCVEWHKLPKRTCVEG